MIHNTILFFLCETETSISKQQKEDNIKARDGENPSPKKKTNRKKSLPFSSTKKKCISISFAAHAQVTHDYNDKVSLLLIRKVIKKKKKK